MNEQSSVTQFIESSGFPLEFAAADALTKAGFITHQGRTYETPAGAPEAGESTFREIDVLADLVDTRSPMPIHLVVECKHLSAPWVIISGERDRSANVQPILSTSTYVDPDALAAHSRGAFDITPPIAFGLVQVVTKTTEPGAPRGGTRSTNQAFDAVRTGGLGRHGCRSAMAAERRRAPCTPGACGRGQRVMAIRIRPRAGVDPAGPARMVGSTGRPVRRHRRCGLACRVRTALLARPS